jgi:hypothetical protein
LSPDLARKLVTPPTPDAVAEHWWSPALRVWQALAPAVVTFLPLALLGLILTLGATLGRDFYAAPPTAVAGGPGDGQSGGSAEPRPGTPRSPGDDELKTPPVVGEVPPVRYTLVSIVMSVGIAAVALGVGLAGLLQARGVVVQDSPEFVAAINIWTRLLLTKRPTPRSLKYFLNRLRYAAMRQRAVADPPTRVERLRVWLGWQPPRPTPKVPDYVIPEPTLVALSAVQDVAPAVLTDAAAWAALEAQPGQEPAPVIPVVVELKVEHAKQFLGWTVTEQDRSRLAELTAGLG